TAGLRYGLRYLHETTGDKDNASHGTGGILKELPASAHGIPSGWIAHGGVVSPCGLGWNASRQDSVRSTRGACIRASVAAVRCLGKTGSPGFLSWSTVLCPCALAAVATLLRCGKVWHTREGDKARSHQATAWRREHMEAKKGDGLLMVYCDVP